jgi:hypothetical protein
LSDRIEGRKEGWKKSEELTFAEMKAIEKLD